MTTGFLQPNFTCPRCGKISYNSNDIAQGYCAWCQWWTGDPSLGSPEVIAEAERGGALRLTPAQLAAARQEMLELERRLRPCGKAADNMTPNPTPS